MIQNSMMDSLIPGISSLKIFSFKSPDCQSSSRYWKLNPIRPSDDVILEFRRDLPIVAMIINFDLGSSSDPVGKEGLTYLALKTGFRTTKKYKFEEFQRVLEREAIFIGTTVTKTGVSVSVSTMRDQVLKAIDIVSELLLEPAFRTEDFLEVKRVTLASIAVSRDDLFSVLGETLYKASMKEPFAHPNMGYLETVNSIELEEAKAKFEELKGRYMTLSVVGDIPEPIERLLDRWQEFKQAMNARNQPELRTAEFIPGKATDKLNKLQVGIAIGFKAPSIYDEEGVFSFSLIRTTLSSMSSRLFMKLREEMSLAYSVGASMVPYPGNSLLYAYITTAREKLEQAKDALVNEMLNLKREPPTESEIDRAKRYLKGLYKLSLQYRSAIASSYSSALLLKLPVERFTQYEEKVNSISYEKVLEYLDALQPEHSLALVL